MDGGGRSKYRIGVVAEACTRTARSCSSGSSAVLVAAAVFAALTHFAGPRQSWQTRVTQIPLSLVSLCIFWIFWIVPWCEVTLGYQSYRTLELTLVSSVPYVLNITATPPARNQSALAVKLGN